MTRKKTNVPATNYVKRTSGKWAVRFWSVKHAGALESLYNKFSNIIFKLHPLFEKLGYARLESSIAVVEKTVKYTLFDCRMCGDCILSSTGMACPMNCQKNLRNGPCGGVRENGNCEVEPQMPCVWVEAWQGSRNMKQGDAILDVQSPLDHSLRNTSSWLRATRNAALVRSQARGE